MIVSLKGTVSIEGSPIEVMLDLFPIIESVEDDVAGLIALNCAKFLHERKEKEFKEYFIKNMKPYLKQDSDISIEELADGIIEELKEMDKDNFDA